MKKIAIVTGASTGIGKETAILLAENDYYVFAIARRQKLLDEIKSDCIETIALDVTDDESVNAAVKHIQETKGRVDLLVNNAGFAQLGSIECVTLEAVKRQYDVNLFGYVRFMHAVLPGMRKQRSGRIINVTSAVGKVSMPLFGWYAGTKHAIEAITDALREEVRQFSIGVSLIEPGVIDTPFLSNQTKLLKQHTPHVDEYNNLLEALPGIVPEESGGVHPKVIAEAILEAAEAKNAPIRRALPADAVSAIQARRLLGDRVFFTGVRKMFKQ